MHTRSLITRPPKSRPHGNDFPDSVHLQLPDRALRRWMHAVPSDTLAAIVYTVDVRSMSLYLLLIHGYSSLSEFNLVSWPAEPTLLASTYSLASMYSCDSYENRRASAAPISTP